MNNIVRYDVDLTAPQPLTVEQQAELDRLEGMEASEIDCGEQPELDETFWRRAVRNPFRKTEVETAAAHVDRGSALRECEPRKAL